MKILHVISQLTKGGGERIAVELANSFARAGDDVTMLVTHPVDSALLQNKIDQLVELRFVSPVPRSRVVIYLLALRWLITNRDFVASRDILHAHLSFGSTFGTMAVLLRAMRGQSAPKVLETYHAVGMNISSFKRRIHMLLARSHDALVSFSADPTIERFQRRHPRIPFALIKNGVSFSIARPPDAERIAYRRSLGIPDDAQIVGTVGRLAPDRMPDRMIQVFAEIAKERPSTYFYLGGGGSEKERVSNLIDSLGLQGRVAVPGIVSRLELPFSIIDVYVAVNVGPATGVAAMEAAAAGVPVVALQLDITHKFSGNDWIYSSTSPGSVASEAVRLLDDCEQLRLLGERQRLHVESYHGVGKMAAAYRDFYQLLLATAQPWGIKACISDKEARDVRDRHS